MKRTALLLVLLTAALCGMAQPREKSVGIQTNYHNWQNAVDGMKGTDYGVGVRFQYEMLNQFYVVPNANIYFGEGIDYDASIDFHYMFMATMNMCVYPILGACYADYKNIGTTKSTLLGGNLGLGFQYTLSSSLTLNGEYKYQMFFLNDADCDVINFGLSLSYRF